MPRRRPPLTVAQILVWADAHHARTGAWPHSGSGPIAGAAEETWSAVNSALVRGARGLPGGLSLARLLEAKFGKRGTPGPLTAGQILAWADAHHARTGRWPTAASGPVAGAPGHTWRGIDGALRKGTRGLPGDSSLSWFLAENGRGGNAPASDRPPQNAPRKPPAADAAPRRGQERGPVRGQGSTGEGGQPRAADPGVPPGAEGRSRRCGRVPDQAERPCPEDNGHQPVGLPRIVGALPPAS